MDSKGDGQSVEHMLQGPGYRRARGNMLVRATSTMWCLTLVATVLWCGCGREVSLSETEEEASDLVATSGTSTPVAQDAIAFRTVAPDVGLEPEIVQEEYQGPRILRIALGAKHTCALDDKGDVYCWGKNSSYQAGVEGPEKVLIPVKVPHVENAIWLEANAHHTCAAVRDGSLWCWGQPGPGQGRQLPKKETGVKPVRKVWIGANGAVCAGFSDGSNCLSTVKGRDDSVQWLGGKAHECLAFRDGHVECRGANSIGQLGNGSLEDSERRWSRVEDLPTVRVTKRGAARVASGRTHTCAAVRSGDVYCWGGNKYGQLGSVSKTLCGGRKGAPCKTKAVKVAGVADALDVVSRYDHSCARLTNGQVTCWGHERYGVLGPRDADSNLVKGVDNVRQVALGRTHTCVLLRDGSVTCWGMNADGQSGGGAKTRVKKPSSVAWEAKDLAPKGLKPAKDAPKKKTGERKLRTKRKRRG